MKSYVPISVKIGMDFNSHYKAQKGLQTCIFTPGDRSTDIPRQSAANERQWNICGPLFMSSMVLWCYIRHYFSLLTLAGLRGGAVDSEKVMCWKMYQVIFGALKSILQGLKK